MKHGAKQQPTFPLHKNMFSELICNNRGGPGPVRFSYGMRVERFERFRFSALLLVVPLGKGGLCLSKFSVPAKRFRRFWFCFRSWGWKFSLPPSKACPKRVGVKKFVPSLESLFSLDFKGGNLGCPGNFAGSPGGVQKVCAKQSFFVRILRSPAALNIIWVVMVGRLVLACTRRTAKGRGSNNTLPKKGS